MKSGKLIFCFIALFMILGCGGGGGGENTASAARLVSVTVTPSTLTLIKDTTGQFTATGRYSDGSTKNITSSAAWNSSNTAIATIDAAGTATALATGETEITASLESVTSSPAVLKVVTAESLEITPAHPSIGMGATQAFTATAYLSDGSTQNVTTAAIWSSSVPAVAAVGNTGGSKGWVTAFETGTTTLTASWGGLTAGTSVTVTPMDNVMKITANGSLCSSDDYPNKPCVSVTICAPGTTQCRTVDDILLDTGSTGLRVFKSVISDLPLTPVANATGQLANCTQYLDETAHWGPVQRADVILGNEKASNIPILVIDASFASVPSSCGTPEASPAEAKLNGILGISLFKEDCGALCADNISNKYYVCGDSTCSATTAPLTDQLKNPIAALPDDNNGAIIKLPAIAWGGAASVDGVLVMGIGTRSNNAPAASSVVFTTDAYGEFTTIFRGRTYNDSFMDTGSNGLFFNKSGLSSLISCGDWYCPSSTQSLSATIAGNAVDFRIGNATDLLNTSYHVFMELGGPYASFDWGLPFFLGRSVYVGIEGKSSALGTGPYLGYSF